MSRVALTGASGLLGSNLIVALREQGVDVRALYRSDSSVAHLKDIDGVEWIKGDLDDEDAMASAFTDTDAVFHVAAAVSILPKVTPQLHKVNVDGTRAVLNAVHKAKPKRFIHTSSTVATGLATTAGVDADENSPWNFAEEKLNDGYCITKKQSEDLVHQALKDTDLDAVIVNPGYLFGPMDSKPSSGKLVLDVVKGKVPGVTSGTNSFVDVRDVARGMVLAWQKGRRGERYILSGHNLRFSDALTMIAQRANVKAPTWNVPFAVAYALGLFGDAQAALTGREPLLTSAAARWAFCDRFRSSSKKAQDELGYTISPIEGAIDACIEWFRTTGRL